MIRAQRARAALSYGEAGLMDGTVKDGRKLYDSVLNGMARRRRVELHRMLLVVIAIHSHFVFVMIHGGGVVCRSF